MPTEQGVPTDETTPTERREEPRPPGLGRRPARGGRQPVDSAPPIADYAAGRRVQDGAAQAALVDPSPGLPLDAPDPAAVAAGQTAVTDAAAGMPDRSDAAGRDDPARLFAPEEQGRRQAQWQDLQVSFVDDPRRAVSDADALVVDVLDSLRDAVEERRGELRSRWQRDGEVPTEDLRLTLRRYRSVVRQLLRH
ncbi:hypothetical protein FHR81_003546 [Actinoalloteichus hoggarensis]|uniref:hypothetical protein n=1 Tax=Actinoalloteichus hoggarensis TaxID=1470176 RepID=UPI0012FDD6FB|nr:hypothetical protein [Actinoalloteichus hoggarensis]MBB5922494.1 hypothetical protein [Actinoalloteichus hoggarensis]